ncbi:MAG: hypothetical protein IJJ62_03340 [Prevotella sp.]|nr:hypothetical protein [Prevotella sp.]
MKRLLSLTLLLALAMTSVWGKDYNIVSYGTSGEAQFDTFTQRVIQ